MIELTGTPVGYLILLAALGILHVLKPSRRWAAWQSARNEAKRQKRIVADPFGLDLHCK